MVNSYTDGEKEDHLSTAGNKRDITLCGPSVFDSSPRLFTK